MAAVSFGVLGAFFITSQLASISFYVSPVGLAILLGLRDGEDPEGDVLRAYGLGGEGAEIVSPL